MDYHWFIEIENIPFELYFNILALFLLGWEWGFEIAE